MHHISPIQTPDLNGRWDIYGAVHKGLRMAQLELLVRIGRADFGDEDTVKSIISDMRMIMMLGTSHLKHENDHIHRAMENKQPSEVDRLEDQHDSHERDFAALEDVLKAIEDADAAMRKVLARRLYLGFTAFIAHDLEHMHEEETVANPMLHAMFTDHELEGIEMDIIAQLPPEKVIAYMRLMIPASNPDERASLLGGVKASAPPEAFKAVIDLAARPTLDPRDFADLSRRLGIEG
jgi:hypothetical protein